MPVSQRKTTVAEKGKKPKTEPTTNGKPIKREIAGLSLILFGVMLLLAPALPGDIPNYCLFAVRFIFGQYGAVVVSLALIVFGLILMGAIFRVHPSVSAIGVVLIFLASIGLLQLCQQDTWELSNFHQSAGGGLGVLITRGLNPMGALAWLPLVFIGLVGISLLTETPLWKVIALPFKGLYLITIRPLLRKLRERREAERQAKVAELKEDELRTRGRREVDFGQGFSVDTPTANSKKTSTPICIESESAPHHAAIGRYEPQEKPAEAIVGVPSKNPDQLQFADEGVKHPDNRPYTLPPIDLLTFSPKPPKQKTDDVQEKIAVLETTLSNFSIDAKVVAVERGPRVTRFELVPPPGIRVNRITNLADDIALSLSALDVRIEAPVPGKGVVGIEVPNREPVVVDVREIVESDAFTKSKSPLTVALGRDIAGHPRVADLSRMPHLLIAGATNSGKSVCINCLICSVLMRATPQQVKFLMVDPKRVELSLFQSIPHLIAPVAYDAKHAAGLLRWAIREMEQRYEMFAEKGVRNIIGFNEQSRLEQLEELPYILIIIDELADLMMQAAAEFEASICRLAQLARATGIHLVIATQRPSVNVITGTIKANVPSRIAFAVASQVDSRTILDINGAERLVGMGDMLYMPIDANKPSRIQGAYVSEKDINRIVEHVKEQGKPNFSEEIVAIEEEAMGGEVNGGFSDEPEDDLFEKALDFIRATKYASTSMLQRKFRIGYTRAARIMDLFEERGYVGPGQGSKPREVIFAPSSSVVGRPAGQSSEFAEMDENDIFEEE